MLEVDKHVRARGGLVAHGLCPASDVLLRVAFIAQAEVRVACGHLGWCPEVFIVRDAQREVARFEPLVHLVAQPRAVSKLECGAYAGGQALEERIEYLEILLEARRQLKQKRPELRP